MAPTRPQANATQRSRLQENCSTHAEPLGHRWLDILSMLT